MPRPIILPRRPNPMFQIFPYLMQMKQRREQKAEEERKREEFEKPPKIYEAGGEKFFSHAGKLVHLPRGETFADYKKEKLFEASLRDELAIAKENRALQRQLVQEERERKVAGEPPLVKEIDGRQFAFMGGKWTRIPKEETFVDYKKKGLFAASLRDELAIAKENRALQRQLVQEKKERKVAGKTPRIAEIDGKQFAFMGGKWKHIPKRDMTTLQLFKWLEGETPERPQKVEKSERRELELLEKKATGDITAEELNELRAFSAAGGL